MKSPGSAIGAIDVADLVAATTSLPAWIGTDSFGPYRSLRYSVLRESGVGVMVVSVGKLHLVSSDFF